MDTIGRALDDVGSTDKAARQAGYRHLMDASAAPVDWAYDVWDRLVAGLRDPDNHVRSICAQVLCSLAASDPEQRIVRDFPALLELTRDARFVTARHCLQSLWKVGAVGGTAAETYRAGLAHRFAECRAEKNWSLIRYDIVCSLRAAFDVTGDETLRTTAQELIATEDDARYRKKYAGAW